MNILVTGSRGQLGSEIQELSSIVRHHRFFFLDLPDLDITEPHQVESFCARNDIRAIVNCAAYTSVDRAESDASLAYRVNSDGAAVLAYCAAGIGALLVHISTDYVFDGRASVPYRESDPTSPLGVYGKSKWEGEERIREIAPSYIIVRTSWLYSSYGANFLKTMLRLGSERESLNVVFDQVGTPTSAADLAGALISILDKREKERTYAETYHYSNEGVCSWYDFAVSIMEMAGLECTVLPVDSTQYLQSAERPHFSVLDKSLIKRAWGLRIPHWRSSLALQLEKILQRKVLNH
ncbi:MAG: dTDP-4-dehydrorhamnose reductase [Chlorobiaceae bacterium]|nr:dTDP-4-dehydrorhamnose reductase [Chlorobiaceae bacterium]NTW10470.1 dTDP-4-dehydrorhamnose reductase [Chlorobiaceae bacterium]